MNEEEISHIQKNRLKLLEFTTWNRKLAALLSINALSVEDLQHISAEATQIGKASRLYDIMVTRTNGVSLLYDALVASKQTGAADILKPLVAQETVAVENTCENHDRTRLLRNQENSVENNVFIDSCCTFLERTVIKSLIVILYLLLIVSCSIYFTVSMKSSDDKFCPEIYSVDEISQHSIHDVSELENLMKLSATSTAINLTIKLTASRNSYLVPQVTIPKVVSITLQGNFCTEMVLPLLKQLVCVTVVYLDVSQANNCTNGERAVNDLNLDTKLKLPYVRNLTTIGMNFNNGLLLTIANNLEIGNLTAIKFLYSIIGGDEIGTVRYILKQLIHLTYLEIGAVLKSEDALFSKDYSLLNVRNIVYNSYENTSFLEKGKGKVYLNENFCNNFPNITSFVNTVGNLDRKNSDYVLKCGQLRRLELGVLIDEARQYINFPVHDHLSNLERFFLRIEFTDHCPNYFVFSGIENLNLITREVKPECVKNPAMNISVDIKD